MPQKEEKIEKQACAGPPFAVLLKKKKKGESERK